MRPVRLKQRFFTTLLGHGHRVVEGGRGTATDDILRGPRPRHGVELKAHRFTAVRSLLFAVETSQLRAIGEVYLPATFAERREICHLNFCGGIGPR